LRIAYSFADDEKLSIGPIRGLKGQQNASPRDRRRIAFANCRAERHRVGGRDARWSFRKMAGYFTLQPFSW